MQGEYVIVLFIKNSSKYGDFPGGPVAHCVLPVQRVQVQSLVRELDPTLLHGTAKKKNKQNGKETRCSIPGEQYL